MTIDVPGLSPGVTRRQEISMRACSGPPGSRRQLVIIIQTPLSTRAYVYPAPWSELRVHGIAPRQQCPRPDPLLHADARQSTRTPIVTLFGNGSSNDFRPRAWPPTYVALYRSLLKRSSISERGTTMPFPRPVLEKKLNGQGLYGDRARRAAEMGSL
jgi:hypothetical protein